MKYKKIAIALMIGMVCSIIAMMGFCAYEKEVSIALPDPHYTPNVQVLMLKYEPFPVNPGEYFDVWLKIGNEESSDIESLTIELMPQFPFSLDASENATRYFGKIYANSIVLVHYKVRVSEDAVEGINRLKFRYRYVQSDLKWIEDSVDIMIQTREAVLAIISVNSEPESIAPGGEGKVT
ncbi:MAG: hypothetical protein N3D84_03545, partial [Candidatus Woesearchaeota archaeon]|nr:hypothetical protein [Candidatus Woesearchaeota archaeon]